MADYVNKQEFYDEVCIYLDELKLNPEAPIHRKLAEMIYKTVCGTANLSNFYNYTYKDDMIGDALLHICKYLKNFDPVKYKNAHAYVTQGAVNVFLQRMAMEDKHTYIRYKKQLTTDSIQNCENDGNHEILKGNAGDFTRIEEFVVTFEGKKADKKKKLAEKKNI